MSSLPRPLPKRGPVAARWETHRRRSRAVVMARAYGRCEVPGCRAEATEWAHMFGRRHLVAEPHASSPELTAALCRSHHQGIDRGLLPDTQLVLRWAACQRFGLRWGVSPVGNDPLAVIRRMVDEVERRD